MYYAVEGTNVQMRSHDLLEEVLIVLDTFGGNNLTRDEKLGWKGPSVLREVGGDFDELLDLTMDYMHLIALGVSRSLFKRTFAVGPQPVGRQLVHARLSTEVLDDAMLRLKGLSDFERRPRPVHVGDYKASGELEFETISEIWARFQSCCRS